MALFPETLPQLRTIVQNAKESGAALVPVSSAAPHLHGASQNELAESVNFSKMNRIIKIDRPGRYVRVEAGVTFGELMPKVKEAGLRLNHPFLPRAGKSVTASLLEREGGIVPKYQYDYTDPLLNAEIVYGTGDVFRTGSAAGPGPIEELTADMVCPWGPGTIDFIRFLCGAQGTMGFVTWTTMKAEILPAHSRLFFISSDDPGKLTRLAAELLRDRIPDDCIILNRVNFAAAFASDADQFSYLMRHTPPWILLCRICGYERYPKERIRIYTGYLTDRCRDAGLTAGTVLPDLDGLESSMEDRLLDCDRSEVYWKLRFGSVRETVFLSSVSRTPACLNTITDFPASCSFCKTGLTVLPQVQGRAFRVECDLYYDPSDASARRNTETQAVALEETLIRNGAFFDRPYGPIAETVLRSDPAFSASLLKMKKIFDPAGIFNPGKLCF